MTRLVPLMPCLHRNVSDTGRCDVCGSWLTVLNGWIPDPRPDVPDVPPSDKTLKNLAKIDRRIT